MSMHHIRALVFGTAFIALTWGAFGSHACLAQEKLPTISVDCKPKPIAEDRAVKYDFDIVYVRVPRKYPSTWAEVNFPHLMPAAT